MGIVDEDEAEELYGNGWSVTDLAFRYGVDNEVITDVLRWRGVHLRSAPLTDAEKAEIVRLYVEERLDPLDVSRRVNRSPQAVRNVLEQAGVRAKTRLRAPQVRNLTDPKVIRKLAVIIDTEARYRLHPPQVVVRSREKPTFLLENAGGRWTERSRLWALNRILDIETVLVAVLPHMKNRRQETEGMIEFIRVRKWEWT